MIKFFCIFCIFFAQNSFANVKIAVDHPFISSAINEIAPGKFEYISIYQPNMHDEIYLLPNQIAKIRDTDLIFSITNTNIFEKLNLKNKLINLADCSKLKDEFCNTDKHFWLSLDSSIQSYEQILNNIARHLTKNEIKSAKKVISDLRKYKISCKEKMSVFTSHNFGARISKIATVNGYIFNHGAILPNVLQKLQQKPETIVSDGILSEEFLRKIHKETQIITIDADGNSFLEKNTKIIDFTAKFVQNFGCNIF